MAAALLLLQALGALGVCCTARRAMSGLRGLALLCHAVLLPPTPNPTPNLNPAVVPRGAAAAYPEPHTQP